MKNDPQFIIVHHSAGPDDDELQCERIRWYHRFVRGWRDVGYHRIYERVMGQYVAIAGRPLHMVGAHAPGYNHRSIGVCFVGDFTAEQPTAAHLAVGARDIAGLCVTLGIPVEAIKPHKAVRATECPGNAFPFGLLIDLVNRYISSSGEMLGQID